MQDFKFISMTFYLVEIRLLFHLDEIILGPNSTVKLASFIFV